MFDCYKAINLNHFWIWNFQMHVFKTNKMCQRHQIIVHIFETKNNHHGWVSTHINSSSMNIFVCPACKLQYKSNCALSTHQYQSSYCYDFITSLPDTTLPQEIKIENKAIKELLDHSNLRNSNWPLVTPPSFWGSREGLPSFCDILFNIFGCI